LHPHIPSHCQLITEGIVAEFNFLAIDEVGEVELSVTLTSQPIYPHLAFTSRPRYYSIWELKLLIEYLEAHLSRIGDGKYDRAPHGFLLLQSEFLIEAEAASVFQHQASFGLQFFIDIGGRNRQPHVFVGFATQVEVNAVIEFIAQYAVILNNIEADSFYPHGGLFPEL
jgi:hypothetical protein